MTKMKTKKAVSKRIRKTGTGKYKRSQAYTSHFMRNKTSKQKRNLRKSKIVSKSDAKRIQHLLQD